MILVLAPLAVESRALAGLLPEGMVCVQAGMGREPFTRKALEKARELKPRLLVGVGGCGALVDELNILDVVIAGHIIEHDGGGRFQTAPMRAREWPVPVRFADIACGDENITTPERALEIHRKTGAKAVTWESAAHAAHALSLPFLEIRAVTDMCGAKALADFKRHIAPGMERVAQVLAMLEVP